VTIITNPARLLFRVQPLGCVPYQHASWEKFSVTLYDLEAQGPDVVVGSQAQEEFKHFIHHGDTEYTEMHGETLMPL